MAKILRKYEVIISQEKPERKDIFVCSHYNVIINATGSFSVSIFLEDTDGEILYAQYITKITNVSITDISLQKTEKIDEPTIN
jgi:hypothetical protein